jgi:amidase
LGKSPSRYPQDIFDQMKEVTVALALLSAGQLAAMISRREASCVEVMTAVLAQVTDCNAAINAIVSLRDHETLLAEAAHADKAVERGPLHGIPMAVKDLVATKGLRTTYGSAVYADHVPAQDDLLAARMRAAGALFIGKTNTPEWGHGSHSFNPVHGVTRNPYDLSRTAGGSSGGAAAALAARMVPLADGSDMMGSLRNPAAFCNVYGFRPTWGLVPGDAVGDTFLATLATEGPMARSIADLAMLLDVQAGENPAVPFGRSGRFSAPDAADMRGKRIAWLGDWGGSYTMEPGILTQSEMALRVFENLGAEVVPLPPPFPAQKLWQAWVTLRAMLNAGAKRSLYHNPAQRALTKPETLWEIEQGQSLTAEAVYDASSIRSRWYAKAAGLFDRFDALVLPSAQVWPFPAEWRWPQSINDVQMDTYHRWMEVVVPASLIGVPALALPAGFGQSGLPMGIQLIGRSGADTNLLAMGQAYHAATDWPGTHPPKP